MSLNRQEQLLLDHMKHYGGISTLDAIRKYNIVRPASRIRDLRQKGYVIITEMKYKTRRDGSHTKWAFYRLVS